MQEDDGAGLAEAFWSVARRLRRSNTAALAPWDITPSQMRALRTLQHHGRLRSGELAEQLRIAARSATEVIDGLAERALVERAPDPGDRRATLVHLTDQGVRMLAAVRAARAADADALFAVLSPADRTELRRILGSLRDGP